METNTEITYQEIPEEFMGKGGVKGFKFTQVERSPGAYLYHVQSEKRIYYEIFRRKTSPVCLDFAKRIYSDTEQRVSYPKANAFGVWAWTYNGHDKAINKFDAISNEGEIDDLLM